MLGLSFLLNVLVCVDAEELRVRAWVCTILFVLRLELCGRRNSLVSVRVYTHAPVWMPEIMCVRVGTVYAKKSFDFADEFQGLNSTVAEEVSRRQSFRFPAL